MRGLRGVAGTWIPRAGGVAIVAASLLIATAIVVPLVTAPGATPAPSSGAQGSASPLPSASSEAMASASESAAPSMSVAPSTVGATTPASTGGAPVGGMQTCTDCFGFTFSNIGASYPGRQESIHIDLNYSRPAKWTSAHCTVTLDGPGWHIDGSWDVYGIDVAGFGFRTPLSSGLGVVQTSLTCSSGNQTQIVNFQFNVEKCYDILCPATPTPTVAPTPTPTLPPAPTPTLTTEPTPTPMPKV
jgi:hypothetical protein